MDYINEAKKFIRRAQDASYPEVVSQNLAMADWCLAEAMKERDGADMAGAQRDDFKIAEVPPMKA
jgi:hypothetical protein